MFASLLAVAAQATTLQPLSRTASAITGPIHIAEGSIKFGKRQVAWRKIATTTAVWDLGGEKTVSATVHRLVADPGVLLNRNHLCGPREPARYVVVWRIVDPWGTTTTLGVWSSATAPTSGNSPGLCATYSYE